MSSKYVDDNVYIYHVRDQNKGGLEVLVIATFIFNTEK